MDVSIIIVNYNTTKLLVNCLKTIYQYTIEINFEIIIVDNNSPNRDIKELLDIFPDIKLILNPQNVGFGAANNLGVDNAKGKYLFFLNPDTLLVNNSIKYFFNFYELNDEKLKIGAIGSVLLDENLNINGSYSETYNTFPNEILNSIKSNFFAPEKKEKFLNDEDYRKVAWISGADLFIKKIKFIEINRFDENIFMYYEEVDLQKRLNIAKLNNYVVKGPRIIHLEGGSFNSKMTIGKKKIIDRSKMYFYKKYSDNKFTFFINKELFKILSWVKICKDYNMKEAFNYVKFLNSL